VVTLTTGAGTAWFNSLNSDQQNLANAFLMTNQLTSALANVANITDLENIILQSIGLGSLVVQTLLVSSPSQDFTSFSNSIASNINQLPGFTVLSSSLTVNGAESSTTPNLGLILGITVPLVLLLAVLIIFVKIYMGDANEKSTEETEKEIQQL
jgi:hypothetical protein